MDQEITLKVPNVQAMDLILLGLAHLPMIQVHDLWHSLKQQATEQIKQGEPNAPT